MGGIGSGAKGKPAEQLRRSGHTKRLPADGDVALLASAADIEATPLRPLGPAGKQAWTEAMGVARHWIAESDLLTLQTYCEVLDDYQRWRVLSIEARNDWRAERRVEALRKQVLIFGAELGLTPLARRRMGVAEVRIQAGLAALGSSRTIDAKEDFASVVDIGVDV